MFDFDKKNDKSFKEFLKCKYGICPICSPDSFNKLFLRPFTESEKVDIEEIKQLSSDFIKIDNKFKDLNRRRQALITILEEKEELFTQDIRKQYKDKYLELDILSEKTGGLYFYEKKEGV